MRAGVVSTDPEHGEALATVLRRYEHRAEVVGMEEALERVQREELEVVLLDLAALHDSVGLVRRLREAAGVRELWVVGLVDPEAQREGLRSVRESQVDDFVLWPGEEALLEARLRIGAGRLEAARLRRDARFPTDFQDLVDRLPALVFVVTLEGLLLHVNPEALRALGYERAQQLVGSRADALIPKEDRPALALRAALLAAGEQPSVRELQLRHFSGRHLDVQLLTFPLHFRGQEAFVCVGRDLTARREQQAQQLTHERLAGVGILAAGLAHEINNPLAYLLSNLTFVRDELTPAPGAPPRTASREVLEALDEAQQGAQRVAHIVSSLRTFSAQNAQALGPVDLREALEVALRLAGNELRSRARIVRDFRDVPPAWGNAGRLTQVFFNLLVNAAQAIAPGDAERHSVQVSLTSPAEGWVSASVRDSGSGIAPEHLGRLFVPFFTTRPAGQGTGLGLSICYNLVKELGGEIRVRSVVGHGSTFEVLLPCAPASQRVPPPAPEPAAPERRASVLLVDDDVLVGRAFERLLRPYHDVLSFQRARPALDWLRTGAAVDVLFCDLTLPDMGGLELFDALSRARPELVSRLVVVTGGDFTQQARAFVEVLSQRRLEKPFERDQVLALIRQVRAGAYQT
ncbi:MULTISPECIES: ATP-binding protein [Myxococcaceae]|uniref:ATP-binding protein n=1 Tax=Myxococcaceae TaxID=31 RepID=UPI00188EDB23|nr:MULTISPECIES: ATP-binding protein [Myxococcaceae]MBF5044202.1 response regulator [Simulacricoccus sp. 17bor-14]